MPGEWTPVAVVTALLAVVVVAVSVETASVGISYRELKQGFGLVSGLTVRKAAS